MNNKHVCNEESKTTQKHPKHEDTLRLIKVAEGHLSGIEKMIEDDTYRHKVCREP